MNYHNLPCYSVGCRQTATNRRLGSCKGKMRIQLRSHFSAHICVKICNSKVFHGHSVKGLTCNLHKVRFVSLTATRQLEQDGKQLGLHLNGCSLLHCIELLSTVTRSHRNIKEPDQWAITKQCLPLFGGENTLFIRFFVMAIWHAYRH